MSWWSWAETPTHCFHLPVISYIILMTDCTRLNKISRSEGKGPPIPTENDACACVVSWWMLGDSGQSETYQENANSPFFHVTQTPKANIQPLHLTYSPCVRGVAMTSAVGWRNSPTIGGSLPGGSSGFSHASLSASCCSLPPPGRWLLSFIHTLTVHTLLVSTKSSVPSSLRLLPLFLLSHVPASLALCCHFPSGFSYPPSSHSSFSKCDFIPFSI